MVDDKADEVIEELFGSFKRRYKKNWNQRKIVNLSSIMREQQ